MTEPAAADDMASEVPLSPVLHFRECMSERHPELRRQLLWDDVVTIALREGIQVQVLPLSRPARLLRFGARVFIQIDKRLDATARARFGAHELCHYWRDDMGEPCYYADEEWVASESEDFAETFAWLVTHAHPLPPY